jgi:hypothetical protein
MVRGPEKMERVPSSGFHGSGENANKVSGIPTLEPWNR